MDLPPRRPERPPLATINVTPLVDVMLVLLIIFLVTASLGQEGITVALPRAGAPELPEAALTVTIATDGSLFLGSTRVSESRFTEVLRTALENQASKTVLLKADTSVPYGEVVRVMSRIKAAGADQLGMLTAPPED